MKKFIIKLGGSNFSTSNNNILDVDYLLQLKEHLMPFIENGYQFGIVVGGGFLLRKYVKSLQNAGVANKTDLHWIGTSLNVTHAYILKAIFAELAEEHVVSFEDYYDDSHLEFTKPIICGGGGRPGHSGDVDALILAKKLGIDKVVSLKNVDSVYSADPNIDNNAERLDNINWEQYLNVIGNPNEHEPGGNYPIDPVASKLAKESGKEFVIISGKDLNNFSKVIASESYLGTLVK